MFKRAKSGTEYVVIDTETTGLHMDARVIELAMVVVSADGKIKDNFSTFLRGDGTESLCNQEMRFAKGKTNAEVDVVVRVGSQVSLLTCGTTLREDGMLTDLKLKAMEAMQRGRQIGGDKTQVGLFCLASDKQVEKLEQQLFDQSTGPQHRVFGASTLLHFLSDPQTLEDLAIWLHGD